MLNIKEFTERLKLLLDYYEESASSFAEKIGVQRSSISHILSGRNKPSLDFILKILHTYPEVELYWLLNGKGHFPPDENNVVEIDSTLNLFSDESSHNENKEIDSNSNNKVNSETNHKTIERIVIFFNDGSFKSYEN